MGKQRTIYVVTMGRYSDYAIIGVFDDAHLADLCAAKCDQREGPRVEEWPLNPAEGALRAGYTPYTVHLRRDGEVSRVRECGWNLPPATGGTVAFTADGRECFTSCWAKDEQHAVKIANERRAELIASGGWD